MTASATALGLTRSLAAYAAQPVFGAAEPEALDAATAGFIDTIGCLFAGAHEPVTALVLRHGTQPGQAQQAPIPFAARLCSAAQAACVNGTAAHALDYDDVAYGAHPSTVLVPAILAEAHRLNRSGLEALRAYLVGFETWGVLHERERDPYHLKGWHPTSTVGVVAAAAAVGYLNRLPVQTMQAALSIAASHAGGLVANFGTMTKPYHAGRAAASAIDAVALAQLGMTAAPDAIEHHAGLLAALSPQGAARQAGAAEIDSQRPRLLTVGLCVKRYPVCYSCHRVIDGVLALVEQHNLTAQQVHSVQVRIGRAQASMLRNHQPQTGLEAKFSIEFAVASALVARQVGLAQLSDAFVQQPLVQQTMAKVRTAISNDVSLEDPTFAAADRVQMVADRPLDSGEIRYPKGHARQPLTRQELQAKFEDCLAIAGHPEQAASLFARLQGLAEMRSVQALFAMP